MSAQPSNGAIQETQPLPPDPERISEEDRLWLQPAFGAVQQMQQKVAETKAAYEQAASGHQQAVGAFNYVCSRLNPKYNLTSADTIDTETGVITRNK